ncbi:MAG: L-histidine N(alpha)-methyltransferase [Ignavibacteria bacterium]|jgi:dimethylhistidine N-methyltransferase
MQNKKTIDEILHGLSQKQKFLPSKLFYDEKGSKLFDMICELDEYYPTRTEMKILSNNIDEISDVFEENSLLIEFGSGSSTKTRLLLDHIRDLAGYIPIDISQEHLNKSVERLSSEYPYLEIYPLSADYTLQLNLPAIHHQVDHRIIFFPGSTIGNFTKDQAKNFLNRIAVLCGENGGLLIGVDLHKNKDILNAAYNDSQNVTADFNMNMLNRLNKEFGFNFDLDKFEHNAFYNEEEKRIEMHLVSKINQKVNYDSCEYSFYNGESILTEYSFKYTFEDFAEIAGDSFNVEKIWVDEKKLFSVQYLSVK